MAKQEELSMSPRHLSQHAMGIIVNKKLWVSFSQENECVD